MTALEVGAEAPDFELRDQHGRRVALSSFRGSRTVVLVFFPYAFSSVCSSELNALRAAWPTPDRPDVELVTISCDPMFTLRAFSDREKIEFPMLSDFWPHGAVSSAYGVFDGDFGCSKRSTFIVDPDGRIGWSVHSAMPDARDITDYVGALESLGSR